MVSLQLVAKEVESKGFQLVYLVNVFQHLVESFTVSLTVDSTAYEEKC